VDGLKLGARYSLPPCSLGFCGPKGSAETLLGYIEGRRGKKEIKKALMKFEGLYHYLSLIASENGMEPFDSEVVEAYWIGNELLENISIGRFRKMITGRFSGRGKLPVAAARKFASLLPEGAIPHHSFHVLYFNSITGRLPPSVGLLDKCRIGWGEVERIGKGNAVVSSSPLLLRNGSYLLGRERRKKVSLMYKGRPLVKAKKGEIIAFHWGLAVDVLTEKQRDNLMAFTSRSIESVNEARKSKAFLDLGSGRFSAAFQ